MATHETELWGQPVEVEYGITGRHRPERAHDMGFDPPETPEVSIYAVLLSHPTKDLSLDLLPVLGDDEVEKLEIEIEREHDDAD